MAVNFVVEPQTTIPNHGIIKRRSTFTNEPLARIKSALRATPAGLRCRYQALDKGEIRVLCLEAGDFGSPIRASLRHIRLSRRLPSSQSLVRRISRVLERPAEHYEALSYAWGKLEFTEELHLKDQRVIRITPSLWSALQHLRWRDKERRLWADAVCINQEDEVEKSAQVQVMGKIFNSADKVLVWLAPLPMPMPMAMEGHAEDAGVKFAQMEANWIESNESIEIAAFAALTLLEKTEEIWLLPEPCSISDLAKRFASIDHCLCCRRHVGSGCGNAITYVRAICDLLKRPFFTRMWIIQEVRSGKNVELCAGDHRVAWRTLRFMLSVLYNSVLHGDDSPVEIQEMLRASASQLSDLVAVFLDRPDSRDGKGSFAANNVLYNMCAYSSFLCRSPVDRVFAVRPVLQIEHCKSLEPDYSLEVSEVFRRLICKCLTQPGSRHVYVNKSYTFLALVGTENSPMVSSPFWVPNFHSFTNRTRCKHRQYTCVQYAPAATFGAFPPQFRVEISSPSSNQIQTRGRVIGSVEAIRDGCSGPKLNWQQEDSLEEVALNLAQWYAKCRQVVLDICPSSKDESKVLSFLTRGYSCTRDAAMSSSDDENTLRSAVDKATRIHFVDMAAEAQGACKESVMFVLREIVEARLRPLHGLEVLLDPEQLLCEIKIDTGGGVLGWLPKKTLIGDALCVIAGTPYPFVLRAHQQHAWQMIGDAYVAPMTIERVFGLNATSAMGVSRHEYFTDWQSTGSDQQYETLGHSLGRITLC